MKLGCSSVVFRRYSLDQALETIAAAGYEYVDVEATLAYCPHVNPWKDDPERFKDKVAGFGLRGAEALGNHRELITDDQAVADISQAIRWCAAAGVPIVATGDGQKPAEMSTETAISILKDRLAELSALAVEHKICLAIEEHGTISLGSLDGLPRIIGLVASGSLAVNFDTANIHRGDYIGADRDQHGWKTGQAAGLDEVELLRRVMQWVKHVHVKDVIGRDSVILGEGEVDLRECLRLLHEAHFGGVLAYETEGAQDLEEATRMIVASRQFLLDVLARF